MNYKKPLQKVLNVCHFSERQTYLSVYQQMKAYTADRTPDTPDALWFLEHDPVFTQGQAGKPIHILDPGTIPIVQSDRGGQVTYHGPGQLIIYTLIDLKRRGYGIKDFVQRLHASILLLLKHYGITGELQEGAPGIYVNQAKICSLGLRVRKNCTYHGVSLNVNMDLTPFTRINPCGYPNLHLTQLHEFIPMISTETVAKVILPILMEQLS